MHRESDTDEQGLRGLDLTPGPDSVFATARSDQPQNPLDIAILAQTQAATNNELSPFKLRSPG